MADRGLGTNKVTDQLKYHGVDLVIPKFKGRDRSQLTAGKILNSEECSRVRMAKKKETLFLVIFFPEIDARARKFFFFFFACSFIYMV